ncbi:MAG: spermidine synthase, partial [Acetatifactor sp.]|nr:spermidine synthase [Acetatifactor sp.]
RELFASDSPGLSEKLESGSERLSDERLVRLMDRVKQNLVPYEAGGHIMTDDRAPVELLGMRVIDELIRDEVVYYKMIYQEEGIPGLLRSF